MSGFLETLAELHFIVMLLLLVFAVVFLRNPITNMYILLAEWIFNTAPPQISQKYNNIKFSPLTKLNLTTTPELSTKKPRKQEKCFKFETPPRAKQKKEMEINASDFNKDLAFWYTRSNFLRGAQENESLIYPAVPTTECCDAGYRYEEKRFASFMGTSDSDLPPGSRPLRLASVGYYFDPTLRRVVCFSCGESYPNHAPDPCGWSEENIRYSPYHGSPSPPHDPNAPCDPTTFNVVPRSFSASSTRGSDSGGFVTANGSAPSVHNPPLGGASQQLPRAPLTRSDTQNEGVFANRGATPSVGGGFNPYLPAGGASQQLPRAPLTRSDAQNEGAFANHGATPSVGGGFNPYLPAGGASQQLPRAPDTQNEGAFANHGAPPSGRGVLNLPAGGASRQLPRAPLTHSAAQDDEEFANHGATPSGRGVLNLPVSGSPQPLSRAPVTRSATQDDMPSNHGTNTRTIRDPVRQYEKAGVVIAMPGATGDRERTQGPVESGPADHATGDMGAEMVCGICKCQPATGITRGGQAVCYDCVQFSLP